MRFTNHVGAGVLDSPLFSPIELKKNIATMYPKNNSISKIQKITELLL